MKTGLARYEFRHLPLHSQSEFAAMSVECAGDQDAFWQFHDRYMSGFDRSLYQRAGAVALAEELDLNAEEFGQCLDERRHAAKIEEDFAFARARGFRSTPQLLVNGTRVGANAESVIAAVRAAAE